MTAPYDGTPNILTDEFLLHWQMTRCEQFTITSVLERLEPELSLEVGTYKGGSLQVLVRHARRVISVDIDPGVETLLSPMFPSVDFRSGDSRVVLPSLVEEINQRTDSLEFVLVDGDHSAEGVRRDIHALLALRPKKPVTILLHDSFNPACREGMRSANWSTCPFVHSVELDYIPGIYHEKKYDTAEAKTMWGGFACAILKPTPRMGELVIGAQQEGLYSAVLSASSHQRKKPQTFRGKILDLLKCYSSR